MQYAQKAPKSLALVLSAFSLASLAACNLPGQIPVSNSGSHGKVKIDGRASSADTAIQNATATIHQLQIRNTAGQFLTFTEQDYTLNLADLGNGLVTVLGRAQVPDGDYDQLRLITAGTGSVSLTDGSEHSLAFPSGAQSGIKIMLEEPVSIRNGDITSLSVDFDLSHSFVEQGNGDFLFKPVVRVEVTVVEDPNPSGSTETTGTDGSTDGSGSTSGTVSGSGSGDTTGGTTGSTTDGGTTSGDTSGSTGTGTTSGDTSGSGTVSFPVIGV